MIKRKYSPNLKSESRIFFLYYQLLTELRSRPKFVRDMEENNLETRMSQMNTKPC